MSKETQERVYKALNAQPQTPNEIAIALKLNQKTVQSILLELINTDPKVKWKKIGRYRVFWKVCEGK
jgi:predicted transcriptional regulator